MVTVLTEAGGVEVGNGRVVGDNLWLAHGDIEAATGWQLKAEGLCQGAVCIPVPRSNAEDFVNESETNISAWWKHMGRPVLHDAAGETWMLGASAADRAESLETLQAPDFTLPDLDGKMHSLSDYRGKRVFLTTWSSW